MALISKMTHQSVQRPTKHPEVEATYDIIALSDEKFLQITTYGSPNRKMPGKASQVIQLKMEDIAELYKIINEKFDVKPQVVKKQ